MQVSTLVQDVLSRKSAGQTVTLCKKWAVFIVVFIAILVHDLRHSGHVSGRSNLWWWSCLLLCISATLVLLKLLLSYTINYFTITNIEVTDKQRTLLNISEADIGFKPTTPKKASSTPVANKAVSLSSLFNATLRNPPPMTAPGSLTPINNPRWSFLAATNTPQGSFTPINTSAGSWANLTNLSCHNASSSPLETSRQTPGSSLSSPAAVNFNLSSSSAGGSVSANSWTFHRNQSLLDTSYDALSSGQAQVLSSSSPLPPSVEASPITDEAALKNFLKQHKDQEKLRQIMSQAESNNSLNSSLWAYGTSPHSQLSDLGTSLRKNVYQTATKDLGEEANSAANKSDDNKASTLSSSSSGSKIWLKKNVTPQELFQFTENLRIWMGANLLVPLVKDIESTNKALRAAAPEIQIGCVGVDKLKKTAQNISGLKQLADVVPFLDVTVHQDYLVHRLKELSAGGAISAFRWNGGSSTFNSKPWKEEYPTDSVILLHLFAMYMDSKLPPDIQQPEGRMFSSTHVIKAPEKPQKPTTRPLLYLSQVNPPHLKVVLPPDEECEVGSGRNNLFHALLLFIHHVTYQQHSRIANMNLTMSGVNLSWVVRSS